MVQPLLGQRVGERGDDVLLPHSSAKLRGRHFRASTWVMRDPRSFRRPTPAPSAIRAAALAGGPGPRSVPGPPQGRRALPRHCRDSCGCFLPDLTRFTTMQCGRPAIDGWLATAARERVRSVLCPAVPARNPVRASGRAGLPNPPSYIRLWPKRRCSDRPPAAPGPRVASAEINTVSTRQPEEQHVDHRSVLHETRVFPPSAEFVRQANISAWRPTRPCARGRARLRRLLGPARREELNLEEALHPGPRRVKGAVLPLVPRRRAQRLAQLPRPAPRHPADKTAIIFEADDGQITRISYKDLPPGVRVRQRPQDAGHQARRPRHHLHAHERARVVAMQACRPDRRHPLGGLRRLLVEEPARAHHRCRCLLRHHRDEQVRGGKSIPLKPAVDEAIAMGGTGSVKSVVVYRRTGNDVLWHPTATSGGTIWSRAIRLLEPAWVNAEHPLFILYTSGSTGKPKGVQHSTGATCCRPSSP